MFSKINHNNMMLQSVALFLALGCLLSTVSASNGTCIRNATSEHKPEVQLFSTKCVILQMSARLKISNEYILLQNGTVDANTTSTECTSDQEQLTIQFPCAHLKFQFKLNKTQGNLRSLEQISGTFNDTVENKTMTIDLTQHILDFPEATNYRCTSEQALDITLIGGGGVKTSGLLLLSNVKIDAFRQKVNPNSNTFDLTSDHVCNLDSSDWVPIVVFICLVGTIVIVVAFFVGRRRWSERSSYESV